MSLELRFHVQDLPMVVPRRVAGAHLVLMAARAVAHGWRLSRAAVDLPGHGQLMAALTDARGKRCELVAHETSSDELQEAGGWWEFHRSPETDGRVTLSVWLADPPWPEAESIP